MKTRAAIAWAAGKPLEVVTLDLEGPKAGEVLIELKGDGRVPHRRVHALGRRS